MTGAPEPTGFAVALNYKRLGTSADAAASAAKAARLGDTHRKIWVALSDKPRTPDELAHDLEMNLNTVRARISDLRNAGWCAPTGERRTTSAGKAADVIRALAKRLETTD